MLTTASEEEQEEEEEDEEGEEEGGGKEGSLRRGRRRRAAARPSPSHHSASSIIAVTAPHGFTADDVARIAAAASRCGGGCASPALVEAVASAASRLAEAAAEAKDAKSLAAVAAAAADVGGAAAHPACASVISLASDFLESDAELFAGRAAATRSRRPFARSSRGVCWSRGSSSAQPRPPVRLPMPPRFLLPAPLLPLPFLRRSRA